MHGTNCRLEDLDAAVDFRETWQQYRDLDDELERRRRWGIDWEDLAWMNRHIAPKLGRAYQDSDEIPRLVLGYPNNNLYGIPRRNHRTGRAQ